MNYLHHIQHNPYAAEGHGLVFKIGASTGATVGFVHNACAVTREYSNAEGTFPVQSLECVVVPASHSDFATFGDSGALVYGARGNGFGMVWGGMTATAGDDSLHGICFVTPLSVIVESISATAKNCHVSWVA